MLHKKVSIATIPKKIIHKHQRDLFHARRASILIALSTDYEAILSQITLYSIRGVMIQTVSKNVFILTLSRPEEIKKLAC